MRQFYVYIMASRSHRLHVGVTNDLARRAYEHRHATAHFTGRYRINRLVYFETTCTAMSAIAREKELKGWVRTKKIALIEKQNPKWNDLAEDFLGKESETADPSLRSR